jgi:Kef-type K+ transport system membrane component KefB
MLEFLGTSVEFQMSLLLFVALAGYLVASKINQSAVIGEIIIGLVIGPSLLGLITYSEFVKSLAHIGAVVLLFVIGLEFKVKDIFTPKYGFIALCGVIFPWIGGYALAMAFGYPFHAAVFVGTALTATSIAITANVLREMGKLESGAAKAIIGAAVIDDVLGLIALSITVQMAAGAISIPEIAITAAKAGAFLIGGVFIGSRYIWRLVERMDTTDISGRFPELVFIFAIMIAFLYAMAAELIGLSAIVGAFIAGVSFEGVVVKHSKNFREGAEYLHIIFAAIFFVSLGILADLHAVTAGVFLFIVALTAVAVITKLVGCYLPARLQRMSHQDSLVVGFGMSPRGEVAMIVGLLGLNAGLIGQDIFVSVVIMSLATTILTPIILRSWIYKENRWNYSFMNPLRMLKRVMPARWK